ncbi:SBBP repeat-containing protein [Sorangium sp. So ce1014]|uniref:SBBP repeat-containing protein n=1 Tax=Sorangium sp. So ce1014 TaxID=3133326 RepID=UPI003F61F956
MGICAAGIAVCEPGGQGYGPCAGQVVPRAEDCATPEDEDCDGQPSCGLRAAWARSFGGSMAWDVASNSTGDIGLLGYSSTGVDLGGGTLRGGVIAKFDGAGTHLWSKGFSLPTSGPVIAMNHAGMVTVAGSYQSEMVIDGVRLVNGSGSSDIFVASFDPTGNLAFARRFGGAGYDTCSGIAIDEEGNILITGRFTGTTDLGGDSITSAGSTDIYVAMLDPAGNHIFSRGFGSAGEQEGLGAAFDSAGHPIVIGAFSGVLSLGGPLLVSTMPKEPFAAKLDRLGGHLWSKRFEAEMRLIPSLTLGVDRVDNLVISGRIQGTADLGGGPLGGGANEVFVVKLDPAGNHLWSRSFTDSSDRWFERSAVDDDGGVLVTLPSDGTVDFGSGPLTSAGGSDIFVARLDQGGNLLRGERFGAEGDDSALAAAFGAGSALLAGSYSTAFDFGGASMLGGSAQSLFLVKLAR